MAKTQYSDIRTADVDKKNPSVVENLEAKSRNKMFYNVNARPTF